MYRIELLKDLVNCKLSTSYLYVTYYIYDSLYLCLLVVFFSLYKTHLYVYGSNI